MVRALAGRTAQKLISEGGSLNIFIYVVVCLFFIVLLVVGVYNGDEVTVNLILSKVGPVPIGAVIATAVIFGIAFACTIGVIDGIKIRIMNRQQRKQIGRLEEECDTLRMQMARREGPAPNDQAARPGPWTENNRARSSGPGPE
jgi:uncharacterized integral membrane protein